MPSSIHYQSVIEKGKNNLDQLNKYINDPKKFTLILLYAPWCGYCNQFKPIWKEINDELHRNSSFNVIALNDTFIKEMVANGNVLNLNLNHLAFPTIIIRNNKSKVNEYYQGDRTKSAILKKLHDIKSKQSAVVPKKPAVNKV